MKKKRLLFLKFHALSLIFSFLLMGVFSASAQRVRDVSKENVLKAMQDVPKPESKNDSKGTVLLNEGFSANVLPSGWTKTQVGWGWDILYQEARHYWETTVDCDDWLITPAITLPDIPAYLTFYEWGRYVAYADFHGVFISTHADMSDSTLLYDGIPAASYTWYEITADLGAFKGKTVYIGFNYQGLDADLWGIDDVKVQTIDVENYLTSFGFDYIGVDATINEDKTIEAEVPYHVGLDTLTAFFEKSPYSTVKVGSTTQVSGVTKNNFTSPVTYSVKSYLGLTRDYKVFVTKSEPLVSFSVANAISSTIKNDTIKVVVPSNANLTAQKVVFAMDKSTYSLKAGTTVLETGVTTIDVSTNKVITAVAGGFTKNYVLIVTKEGPLNNIRLIGYVDKGTRIGFPASIYANIDETAKTIKFEIPYGTPKDSLLIQFSPKSYVTGLAYNGTAIVDRDTVNFTTNANLVITMADPTKAAVTYAVTVAHNSGSYDNELLTMSINNLAEPLVWDSYGRKISGVMKYDSTNKITPIVSVSALATVTGPTVPFSFKGADTTVYYKVTSQNGLGVSNWALTLKEKAPSTDAKILSYSFVGNLQSSIVDTNVYNVAVGSTDITKIKPTLSVSFGAKVELGSVSPTTADFTKQPVKYTIKAQDNSTKKNYAVYVTPVENVAPVVSLTKGTYSNVNGEIEVKVKDASSIMGVDIALVHKDFMADFTAMTGAKDAIDDAMAAGEFAVVNIGKGNKDTLFNISCEGLKPGIFYAVASDMFDNISHYSADSAVVVSDTLEVSTLDSIVNPYIVYKYTGTATVTYAQTYRNQKFIQDESAGIVIDDNSGKLKDRAVAGDAITGLIGRFVNFNNTLEFQPSDTLIEVLSHNNTVEPVELTLSEFNADMFEYQNMLVKVDYLQFKDADNSNYFTTGVKYGVISATNGQTGTFRTSFYSADYIGDTIPNGVFSIVGIKNINYGESVISARDKNDIIAVEGSAFEVSATELDFSMTGISSATKSLTLTNLGVEAYTVKRVWIEGAPQYTSQSVNYQNINPFSSYSFNVYFAPEEFATYDAVLYIETTNGNVKEVALHAVVSEIVAESIPYETDFEEFGEGYDPINWIYGSGWTYFYNPAYTHSGDFASYIKLGASKLISPEIDLTHATSPLLDVWQMQVNTGATRAIQISTDGGSTWTLLTNVANTANFEYTNYRIPLVDYVGEKVKIAFDYVNPTASSKYWFIEDFKVYEQATTTLFTLNYNSIDFGVVDGAVSATLKISNKGISYFTLDSVILKSAASAFTLANVPATAVEVSSNTVSVKVNFDGTLAENADTIVIYYNDPREGDQVVEVPVSAYGVACSAAVAAVEGTNVAEFAPSWFEYTPAEDGVITISSCGDVADTDLKVYDSCGGKLVAANDDDASCGGANKYASTVEFPAHGGVTYKINWIDTWDPSGFEWSLNVRPLPTGPTLLSVETQALNAEKAKAVLSFENMIELAASKGNGGVYAEMAMSKLDKVVPVEVESADSRSTKTFVPDGDDEGEPNGDQASAKVLTVGTVEAPAKITGKYGVAGDYDWFAVPQSQIGFYFDITLEIEAGVCDMYLVYWNATEEGWYGFSKTGITPGAIGSFHFTQLDRGVDTMYIWVRRSSTMAAVAEPGYGYNLKVWSSAPPVFTIYRDNYRIAGPESMAFSYIDEGIDINTEYCYTVTQETLTGEESGMSNAICVTPKVTAGVICEKAIPVVIGMNQAPSTPYWYSYTATETSALKISSNIAENGDPSEDWNDTWLFVYANCGDATPLYEVDDVENGKIRTSEVEFVAEKGVTYLIQWKRWAAEGEVNAYDAEPFYFTVATSPVKPGEYVENAIPVTLPLVDYAGSSVGYAHNYNAVCGDEYFMQGNDIVYTFDIPYGGTISGGIEGEWVGIHIFKGKVGSESSVVFAGDETGGTFTNKAINPGTYYILVSTQLPTKETDFVINLAFTPYAKQTVTFNVDMNVQAALGNFDLANDSIDVVGTFNLWEHTANMTDEDGDGIYTYTVAPETFYVGEKIRYKYRINADWATAELSDSPDVYRTWTVKNGTNSSNDIYNDVELPKYDVTFKVQMARQLETKAFDASTGKVELDLTGQTVQFAMKDADGDLTYEYTVKNVELGAIEFAFVMDDVAETVARRTATISNDTTIFAWFNDDNTIDVPEVNSGLISIYPNPSNGKFMLNVGQLTQSMNVEILNIQGQVINKLDMQAASQEVNLSTYAKGVYYVRIADGEKVSIKKLVIQ